jgi:hypothetical protein
VRAWYAASHDAGTRDRTFQEYAEMNAKLALTCAAAALCALAAGSSQALIAQVRALAMLDRLEPGDWELREHDAAGTPRRICLRNGRRLIQLRHPGQACSRIVVEDTDSQVTVQYTCPQHGYGRTQIRRESDSLVQIDTQGIAEGLPFAFGLEARRVGSCRS